MAWILAFSGLLAAGCNRQEQTAAKTAEEAREYGKLPALRSLPDKWLREELARIEEEGGTPEQLNKTGVSRENNVAEPLMELFPPKRFPADRLQSLLKESEQIFPAGRFDFNPVQLNKAIKFRKRHDSQRVEARNALKRPQCDFDVQHLAGPLADTTFIDVARLCARLEAFQAAEELFAKHNSDEAVDSLRYMLRLASCLGAEKRVQARLEAAYLRTEAFVVLQAIVSSEESTTQRHVEKLAGIVREHMKTWPHDADAWIGDRAEGMCVYEMARDGNLPLTPTEMRQFRKDGTLESLQGMSAKRVNLDERFYLEAMRKIITSCQQPYYARIEQFDEIQDDLHERRNSYEFPIIAARILLLGIRESQAFQAQDRANWEAWSLALEWATGREPPPYEFNPLTGKRYGKGKYPSGIDDREYLEISNIGTGQQGDDPRIRVPDRRR